ncbi:FAD-binding protein [Deinococcus radiophilus]|uniref:FAD-binding protein n=1 Tax=Deinococcus radiophilus TaxID=32062 RepID=UPI0036206B37
MEVQPAAHYSVGGVRTDLWGRSSVPGLLVAGEAASVGLHGANRLASNSLSEGLVFGARAAQAAAELAPARASGKPEATPALSLPAGVSWAAVQPVLRRRLGWNVAARSCRRRWTSGRRFTCIRQTKQPRLMPPTCCWLLPCCKRLWHARKPVAPMPAQTLSRQPHKPVMPI